MLFSTIHTDMIDSQRKRRRKGPTEESSATLVSPSSARLAAVIATTFLSFATSVEGKSRFRQSSPVQRRYCLSSHLIGYLQPCLSIRGGDEHPPVGDDQEIDEFIEQLISNVDDDELSENKEEVEDSMMEVLDEEDDEEEEETDQDEEEGAERQASEMLIESQMGDKAQSADSADDEEGDTENGMAEKEGDSVQEATVEIEQRGAISSEDSVEDDRPKQKRSKKATSDHDADNSAAVKSSIAPEEKPLPEPVVIPNTVCRFLLRQGRIGHVIIMVCIWIAEFIQTYVPPLASLLGMITSRVFPPVKERAYDDRASGSAQTVNARYAGFVSSGRTKQKKKQARLADQEALEKLRRVGSIREAKYRRVSDSFLKRHQIGPYRDMAEAEEKVLKTMKQKGLVVTREDAEEESDIDWVVEALTKEDDSPLFEETPSSPVGTTVSLGMGSDGPSVTVGVEFGIGRKKKKTRSRRSAIDAVTEVSSVRQKPRAIGPRASDRDGGGGVMGRLRAAGANSIVSRSLLGAYPGDAVPPSEAASADGVIELAQKYGYGDWSSDDEDEEETEEFEPKKRRKTRKKKRETIGIQSRSQNSASTGCFDDFDASSIFPSDRSSSRSSAAPVQRTSTTRSNSSSRTRQNKKSSLFDSSDILGDRSEARRREVRARAPMERLKEAHERLEGSNEDD